MSKLEKRFCQASENNKLPILTQLKREFAHSKHVLEIGSGTGQHALFFSQNLAHLNWQPSDLKENHASVLAWMEEGAPHNLLTPIEFEISVHPWPTSSADAVFTANTAHIMPPHITQLMMELVATHLPDGGVFCQYGPFNVNGQYTSEGNRSFDQHLLNVGCGGIRDLAELQAWAGPLQLDEQISMPANNFLLVWRKPSS